MNEQGNEWRHMHTVLAARTMRQPGDTVSQGPCRWAQHCLTLYNDPCRGLADVNGSRNWVAWRQQEICPHGWHCSVERATSQICGPWGWLFFKWWGWDSVTLFCSFPDSSGTVGCKSPLTVMESCLWFQCPDPSLCSSVRLMPQQHLPHLGAC